MEERNRPPARWKSVKKELMEKAKKDGIKEHEISEEEIKLYEDPKFLLLHQHLPPGLADGPTEWHTWCAIWRTGGSYKFPGDMQHLVQILEYSKQTRVDKNIKANWFLVQEENILLGERNRTLKRQETAGSKLIPEIDPVAAMLKNVQLSAGVTNITKAEAQRRAASQEQFEKKTQTYKQYLKAFPLLKDGKRQYSVHIYANQENKMAYFGPKSTNGSRELTKDHKWVQEGLKVLLKHVIIENTGFFIWAVPRDMAVMIGDDNAKQDETIRLLENAHICLRFWVYEANRLRKEQLPTLADCYSMFKDERSSPTYMSFAQKYKIPLRALPPNRVTAYEAGNLRGHNEELPRNVYGTAHNMSTGEIKEIDSSRIDPVALDVRDSRGTKEPKLNWADHMEEVSGSTCTSTNRFQPLDKITEGGDGSNTDEVEQGEEAQEVEDGKPTQ